MSEAYDDRPDPVLPVGEIRGDDLRRTRFSLAFRGYRMSEVDTLLDRLARQLDEPHARGAPSPAGAPARPWRGATRRRAHFRPCRRT